MKRIVFVIIASLLVMGLVLAGCTEETDIGEGVKTCFWPFQTGGNLTDVHGDWDFQYSGTQAFEVPDWWTEAHGS